MHSATCHFLGLRDPTIALLAPCLHHTSGDCFVWMVISYDILAPRCMTGMGTCHYELGEKEKAMECWKACHFGTGSESAKNGILSPCTKAALQVCPSMPGACESQELGWRCIPSSNVKRGLFVQSELWGKPSLMKQSLGASFDLWCYDVFNIFIRLIGHGWRFFLLHGVYQCISVSPKKMCNKILNRQKSFPILTEEVNEIIDQNLGCNNMNSAGLFSRKILGPILTLSWVMELVSGWRFVLASLSV